MIAWFQCRRWKRIAILLAIALFVVAFADVAMACPTCKEGVAENDPHYQSMAAGYYYSILFMVSMPFIIATTFGTFAYRAFKKAEAQRASDSAAAGNSPAAG
jgi:uncharacterized membrane protein